MIKRLRSYNVTLNAGVDYSLNVAGNLFFALENSGDYEAKFNEDNRFQNVKVGARIKFEEDFERVTLTSSTTQNVKLVCGYGDFDNTVEDVLAFLIPASVLTPVSDVTVAGTATLISAQNSARRELALTLPDTATAGVRIGDASVTATSGVLLLPGVTFFMGTSAAVYGIRTTAVSETLTALEIS